MGWFFKEGDDTSSCKWNKQVFSLKRSFVYTWDATVAKQRFVPSWFIDSDTRPLDSDTQSLCYVYAMIVVITRNDVPFSKAFLVPKQSLYDD